MVSSECPYRRAESRAGFRTDCGQRYESVITARTQYREPWVCREGSQGSLSPSDSGVSGDNTDRPPVPRVLNGGIFNHDRSLGRPQKDGRSAAQRLRPCF